MKLNPRSLPPEGHEWNPLLRWPRKKNCFCGSMRPARRCCFTRPLPRYIEASKAAVLKKFMAAVKDFDVQKIDGSLHIREKTDAFEKRKLTESHPPKHPGGSESGTPG